MARSVIVPGLWSTFVIETGTRSIVLGPQFLQETTIFASVAAAAGVASSSVVGAGNAVSVGAATGSSSVVATFGLVTPTVGIVNAGNTGGFSIDFSLEFIQELSLAVGASRFSAIATSAGLATTSFSSVKTIASVGAAIGGSSATSTSNVTSRSIAAATGTSSVTALDTRGSAAVGIVIAGNSGAFSIDFTPDFLQSLSLGIGAANVSGIAVSTGAATTNFIGTGNRPAVGTATGSSSAAANTFFLTAPGDMLGESFGQAIVLGQSNELVSFFAVGAAAGQATSNIQSALGANFAANGNSLVIAISSNGAITIGHAVGAAIVSGDSSYGSVGTSIGSSLTNATARMITHKPPMVCIVSRT